MAAVVAATAALALLVLPATPAGSTAGQPTAPPTTQLIEPTMSCAELSEAEVGDVPDAATAITSATETTAQAGYPVCDVRGTIEGRIGFVLELPLRTWTGRYLQLGCGAFCGYLGISPTTADGCQPLTNGEFVLATNDTGHTGANGGDASWGRDNPTARVDFGYRSEHLLSRSAKQVIDTFYGQPPTYSYFDSCSNGGRQALILAQRFPHDFDGIIASAPANIYTPLFGQFAPYIALANRDAEGNEILTAEKLAPLHQAAVAACDGYDGLTDGQITDPRTCDFDPASVACPTGIDRPDCLTPAQVETVTKLYGGARDARGRLLYPGGLEPGSELGWASYVVSVPDMFTPEPMAHVFGEQYLKHLAYRHSPPESFTLADVRFDARTLASLRAMGRVYDATDPDLSAFRASGGKLIMSHGWADPLVPPRGTLAYRQAVEDRMGGYGAVQEFYRLFMLPQVQHCGGGDAPDAIDLVTPMLDWVEGGQAPSQVIATQRTGADGATVLRTRPVYNYPVVAAYNGTGDVNDAASFHPLAPDHRPDDHIRWLGSFA